MKRGLILLLVFLLSGCSAFSNQENEQTLRGQLINERIKIKQLEKELATSKTEIVRLEQEIKLLENSGDPLVQQYQQLSEDQEVLVQAFNEMYFDVCSFVEFEQCADELKFFDPRNLNVNDVLFGATIIDVQIGNNGIRSFVVSTTGKVMAEGTVEKIEDQSAYWFHATKLNDQAVDLFFVLKNSTTEIEEWLTNHQGVQTVYLENIEFTEVIVTSTHSNATLVMEE